MQKIQFNVYVLATGTETMQCCKQIGTAGKKLSGISQLWNNTSYVGDKVGKLEKKNQHLWIGCFSYKINAQSHYVFEKLFLYQTTYLC